MSLREKKTNSMGGSARRNQVQKVEYILMCHHVLLKATSVPIAPMAQRWPRSPRGPMPELSLQAIQTLPVVSPPVVSLRSGSGLPRVEASRPVASGGIQRGARSRF